MAAAAEDTCNAFAGVWGFGDQGHAHAPGVGVCPVDMNTLGLIAISSDGFRWWGVVPICEKSPGVDIIGAALVVECCPAGAGGGIAAVCAAVWLRVRCTGCTVWSICLFSGTTTLSCFLYFSFGVDEGDTGVCAMPVGVMPVPERPGLAELMCMPMPIIDVGDGSGDEAVYEEYICICG